MRNHKVSTDEIKLIPIQRFNAILMIKSLFHLTLRMVTGFAKALLNSVAEQPRISVIFVLYPL